MVKEHSYGATLLNNQTESEAVLFMLKQDSRLRLPKKEERKDILQQLNLPQNYSRAFDLVMLPESHSKIATTSVNLMKLIELKTTRKRLPNMPTGFFFGATENEFALAKQLGDNYLFCFVSLHAESPTYSLMTVQDLENKIKTRRVQYQINL